MLKNLNVPYPLSPPFKTIGCGAQWKGQKLSDETQGCRNTWEREHSYTVIVTLWKRNLQGDFFTLILSTIDLNSASKKQQTVALLIWSASGRRRITSEYVYTVYVESMIHQSFHRFIQCMSVERWWQSHRKWRKLVKRKRRRWRRNFRPGWKTQRRSVLRTLIISRQLRLVCPHIA